uniref:Integrase catalytic domain-containing protein n=1 Tax=Nothobranchius furzeri TaxID=105023 RepID=A0A8C6MDF9_NOTFU
MHRLFSSALLLTIMCSATRFPEAIPLTSITTKNVIKALTGFFSVFGLPKVIQSDQGTNFTSRIFSQVAKTLNIKHETSSSYHPESQGVIERWHQTLKTMLRKHCFSSGCSWEEGLPFVLFAVRDAVRDSTGFSPHQLVFGHVPRGPLKALKEKFLWPVPPAGSSLPSYVNAFQRRLKETNQTAQQHLRTAKASMKARFNLKSCSRDLQVGDQVLLLNPTMNTLLSPKFEGPFDVVSKLDDRNYVIKTPLMRRKTKVCHINRLKLLHVKDSGPSQSGVVATTVISTPPEDPDVFCRASAVGPPTTPWSCNSEANKNLHDCLTHISHSQQVELQDLIHSFQELFSDVPSQTHLIAHDITLSDPTPVRMHPNRASPHKRELMKNEVEYLLENGLAKPSTGSLSSPCLLENKPDGTYRFFTDYRKLNAATDPDAFPLPRVDDCIDSVGAASFVTRLDLLKGY